MTVAVISGMIGSRLGFGAFFWKNKLFVMNSTRLAMLKNVY